MAFVYEQSRPPLFSINQVTSEIGPGQYLPLTQYKFDKPNIIPFGVSTFRKFPYYENDSPGPGFYEKKTDDPKKISNEKKTTKTKNPNNVFFTKVERFKNKVTTVTPGPGSYGDNDIKDAKKTEFICNNNKKIIYNLSKQRANYFFFNNKDKQNEFLDNNNNIKNKNATYNSKNKKIISNTNKKMNQTFNKNFNFAKNNNNDDFTNIENEFQKQKAPILHKSKTSQNFYKFDIDLRKQPPSNNKKYSKKQIKDILEKEVERQKNNNILKYRISSIPSKNSTGYELEKSTGKIAKKKSYKYNNQNGFTGEKYDSVGPGNYEIDLPEIWRKTGTCWSKYLCNREFLKTRPLSEENLSSGKNILNDNKLDKKYKKILYNDKNYKNIDDSLISTNNNSFLVSLYRAYATQQMKFKDPDMHHPITNNIKYNNLILNKNVANLPIFARLNDVPGPGYYFDESDVDYIKKLRKSLSQNQIIKKKKTFNMPDLENFVKLKNEEKSFLGPGIYFKENNILKKNNNNRGTTPFISNTKRFLSFSSSPDYQKQSIINEKSEITNTNNSLESSKSTLNINNLNKKKLSSNSNDHSCYSTSNNSNNKNNNILNYRKHLPQNKSLSGTFYRRDIRFRERQFEENIKKEIPGPGSYIKVPSFNEQKKEDIKLSNISINLYRTIIEKNRVNFYKPKKEQKNSTPCVGYYNPDKYSNLLSDVLRKTKYGINSFYSSRPADRGEFFKIKNSKTGPGSYYNDKFLEKKQIKAAFNCSADRFYKGGENDTSHIKKKFKKNLSAGMDQVVDEVGNTVSSEITMEVKENFMDGKKGFDAGIINNSNTPDEVGPGKYSYNKDIYPWLKQSFNIKYVNK